MDLQEMFDNASRQQQAGRTSEAEQLCNRILLAKPGHAFALHLLGILAYQAGRYEAAADLFGQAIEQNSQRPTFHNNLGNALRALDRSDEAIASYRRALAHKPDFAEVHRNLGVTLMDLGRHEEAVQSLQQALAHKADYVEALREMGKALAAQGKRDQAMAIYRQALNTSPEYAEVHNDLGTLYHAQGHLNEAAASYQRAMSYKSSLAEPGVNLTLLLNEQGKYAMALNVIQKTLEITRTAQAKTAFVECVKHVVWAHPDDRIHDLMYSALTEAWGRPSELASSVLNLVTLDSDVTKFLALAEDLSVQVSVEELSGLGNNSLLIALLGSALVCDVRFERFLTVARRILLETARRPLSIELTDSALNFFCALARQCFINEYVFGQTAYENCEVEALRDALLQVLMAETKVPVIWVVAVAAYLPLSSIPHAERLLEKPTPKSVKDLLLQQIEEPAQELRERCQFPKLSVDGETSLLVKTQYEENPYPRWVKMASPGTPKSIARYFSEKFPLSGFRLPATDGEMNILIAGCGTGQQAIEAAWRFKAARILAIDLSISSLAHAARKTRELGMASITYAQADLLSFDWSGPAFDIIECVGVLHHLVDPWAGWKRLLRMLRPGGFMRVGLYSEFARKDIARARDLIAHEGYGATVDDIRRFRQRLLETPADFGKITEVYDFYCISSCRDMLFHVQEHPVTLADVAAFLRDNSLTFLGFDVSSESLRNYRQRFPDDPAATNLAQWQTFEAQNPDTFLGMYQFWIQKEGSP